ncbi:MAG: peptidoglycan-associated lipoprotein [Gallionellales bacterium RIFCSPLOWO2_12_FULL_59_22]|nr:MAG: peptidoglycan-associated lipoprotein [Gallionellales bacterium RIFCSPLOWO2_02_FULL_59_110]OGT05030.1 MAG: peptidoglycan-associated lipoprotein [Gallionellales bacterium RIFCSPLOWO2_02_58_13]OGT12539.1 MAG: peptidoglycan-associated lipoprotein [Gallionellales bacterium RIFCSPLOWO2_12_FULL_59_22]
MKKLVIGIVLVNLLAACASDPKKEPEAAAPKAATSKSEGTSAASQASAAKTEVDELNDPSSILAKRSVYYPFDVAVVQDEDKPVVQAHAKHLSGHANHKVRLEGNCDERGSNEYNLGLGQRRADGVKKMLELGGAKAGQLESVSYGEEKPRCSDHSEACWKQNRRTDLNYAK